MSVLDEVRADRQPLAHVLKRDRGIRKIVEDLYPDRAHFIYELLQNAEDAGSTEASFALGETSVSFEHNGRPFEPKDIWGITDIGEGAKVGEDQIGRFGVGFKAVFAYSETPHIWSPTFAFKICELVLPTEIAARAELGQKTRFEFPFNNPKKSVHDAYAEVEAGLNELADTTLLFLSHLEAIRWQIGERGSGEVRKVQHSDNHIEVLKNAGGRTAASSHFLRFSDSVKDLVKQRVSVAFALDCLPNVTAFNPDKAMATQLRVIPANPGRVAVFFPAEKEASGLRFHLHAPFMPELSRASIKETPANNPLFKQLAELAAASLHSIRALNLLTGDFLAVLPNPQDTIPVRYQLIRAAIIDEMNNRPLTPTYFKSHAPAKHLLKAKASLKDLLSSEDIEVLVDHDDEPPQWAMSAAQKNSNADRFLAGLAIEEWDIDQFIELLETDSSEVSRYVPTATRWVSGPDARFMKWLASKPLEWHQQLYSLLYKELRPDAEFHRLASLTIVRLSDGTYSAGSKCYFSTDGVEHDVVLPRVENAIYLSGKNKTQQDEARKLLEKIGVREGGETEQVQAILKQRYTAEAFKPDMKDLKRFIALVAKDPAQSELFADYFIFKRSDEKWGKPIQIYLDSPILETGLSAYYGALGAHADRAAIAPCYAEADVSIEKLQKFAQAIGVQTRLEIIETKCHGNPEWQYLRSVSGQRFTSPLDQDYFIEKLDVVLSRPTRELAKLVWRTMCALPKYPSPSRLQASYQINSANGPRHADSQLVHTLRKYAWVPQRDRGFVRPIEADRNLLPKGFPFDAGDEWIAKIHFGQGHEERAEESKKQESLAKELGFSDAETFERAKQFVALPLTEQKRLLAESTNCSGRPSNLPDHEPKNPEQRAKRVAQRAASAPERITEKRTRSVSVGLEDVKQDVQQYLRQQYTNSDHEMICQVCKAPLPFKLDDGSYYFEKVEFLQQLKKRHLENYLALCPNHSAMFQHANGSRESLKELFLNMAGNEVSVVLAQAELTIYFTKTHIADLRTVMEVDRSM